MMPGEAAVTKVSANLRAGVERIREGPELVLGVGEIWLITHSPLALKAIEQFRGQFARPREPFAQDFGVFGEFGNIGRPLARRDAAPARQADADICLKTHPRFFAVVADVDATFKLLVDDPIGRTTSCRSSVSSTATSLSRSISSFANRSVRGRLPAWVVRMRRWLVSMTFSCRAWLGGRSTPELCPGADHGPSALFFKRHLVHIVILSCVPVEAFEVLGDTDAVIGLHRPAE